MSSKIRVEGITKENIGFFERFSKKNNVWYYHIKPNTKYTKLKT